MINKPKAVSSLLGCIALIFGFAQQADAELAVAKGLAVELFATSEQLSNPASIDVDHRGRVWIGEAVNYRKKDRKEGDRILILEDSDGDGRADKTKVFYQDPDIDGVHGVCVLGNQAIVSAPDRILLLTDTDGDDQADEKKLLFKGKVLRPVHGQHDHAIHAVMFGPDGRLYFNFGNYSAGLWRADGSLVKDTFGNPVDNSRKPYQEGMVIRCEMDGSQVEVLGHNFRNNWEVTVDSFGSMWQSDNDNGSSSCRVNFVMEYGNYGYRDEKTGADYKTNRTNMEATMQRRMWHQNDPGVIPNLLITGRGAPTGILVYEGNLLPEPFRNQMIHAEPGRNVVWAFPAKQVGAGYKASITNLVHSKVDRNYRPSDVSVAPDGSLIIADWFDPVDCCHRTVNDAGRLFRVAPPKHAYVVPDFDFKTPPGAAKALRNPNLSVRYKAWTTLQAMHEKARPALTKMAADENPRFRARALWTLAAIKDGAQKAIDKALQDENDNLRALALRIARRHGMPVEPLVRRLVSDESALVRRECAVSLHRVATLEAAELWAQLALQHDGKDRWYLEALGIGEKGNETACLNAWLKKVGDDWKAPAGRDLVWRSRAPKAAGLLAKLVLDPEVPESEHPRFMRALDFHSGKAKEDALATLLLNLDAPAEKKKPNILLILVDDMGYGDPKCFNPKSRLKTPAIDRLAREGLMFTDAHAPHSTCIASRYGLLTGRYPIRDNHRFIKHGKITLPKLLKRNGYNTGMAGKWHLGFDDLNPEEWDRELTGGPVDRGFDTFFGMWASLDWPPYFYVKDRRAVELPTEDIDGYGWWTPDRFYSGKWKPGKIAPNFKHVEATPRFTSEAIRLIDQFANKEKPFFLYFALPSPHGPWVPTEEFKDSSPIGVYGDFAQQVDHSIGQVLEALDKNRITKNTLVIFTSDNGPVWYQRDRLKHNHSSASNYSGMKGDWWEGGHRVPFVVRWPSVVRPKRVSESMICFTDFMATFAEIVGDKFPEAATTDSRSFLPILKGDLGYQVRDTMILNAKGPALAYRQRNWKLITAKGPGGFTHWDGKPSDEPAGQLYDLAKDPSEQNNLWREMPSKVKAMRALLAKEKSNKKNDKTLK